MTNIETIFSTILHFIITFGEFFIGTVLVKMIIGHWLAEITVRYAKRLMQHSARDLAIFTHYQERAQGKSHLSSDITRCDQVACAVFKQPLNG